MAATTRRSFAQRLVEFADQSAEASEDTLEIPEDLSALSTDDLAALHAQASEAFTALYGDGTGLTADDLAALSALTDGLEALNAEREVRAAAEAERAEAARALASRAGVEGLAVQAEAEADEDEDVEGSEDGDDSAETPEDSGDEDAAAETVTAAAPAQRGAIRVPMSSVRSRASHRPAEEVQATPRVEDVLVAGADAVGIRSGLGTTIEALAVSLDSRLRGFNKAQYAAAARRGETLKEQFSLAVVRKPFDADMMITGNDPAHIEEVFARAVDTSRLPEGALTAAGWCAPSETVYDYLELESADGLFSSPEVGIARGGINFTQGPSFADIFANTGFSYTEEEADAGDWDGEGGGSKPCYTIDCPDFEEVRLSLDGLCITAGLLQRRGYPEHVARVIRGALIAHRHRMAANKINAIIAGSDAVSMPAGQVGALAPLLTAIELQAEHTRYVHRMSRNSVLEGVFPFWVRGVIRSDLSRRLGVDLISVPDSRINAWFSDRGIAPQFVYNFDDLTGDAADATAWPTTARFLLYPAGTWVAGGADVITLDTIYDSVNLGQNEYTALFTEEGWLMAKRGQDSRVVSVPVCGDGATHAGVLIDCDGTAEVAG